MYQDIHSLSRHAYSRHPRTLYLLQIVNILILTIEVKLVKMSWRDIFPMLVLDDDDSSMRIMRKWERKRDREREREREKERERKEREKRERERERWNQG